MEEYTGSSAFGPEWDFLKLLVLAGNSPLSAEDLARLRERGSLHFGEVLEQAIRHKLLHRLTWHAHNGYLEGLVPSGVDRELRTILLANQHRTRVYRTEAVRLAAALIDARIRGAFTKGICFESQLYGGVGARTLFDVDLMICPEDRDRCCTLLRELGYTPYNRYDWVTGELVFDRRSQILYRMNPDHLPHHARLLNDPLVRYIDIDIANSFTWARAPWVFPVERSIEATEPFELPEGAGSIPVMPPPFHLLFTVLHLYREAWLRHSIDEEEPDVNLSQFMDVYQLWRRYQEELEGFDALVEEHDLVQPVAWVLEHLDRTLSLQVCSDLGLEGRVSEDWLCSAQSPDGRLCWHGEMQRRLQSKDRRLLFRPTNG
jgi:hypothetical protein